MGPSVMRRYVYRLDRAVPTLYIYIGEILWIRQRIAFLKLIFVLLLRYTQKLVEQSCFSSFNDCAARIVTEQFTRTRKGVGRRVQPSGKKKERCFSGFQNPEGSRERTATPDFNNF